MKLAKFRLPFYMVLKLNFLAHQLVSIGAPFGRSIRVRFRIQMFRCMNWIAIKRLPRSLVVKVEKTISNCPLEVPIWTQVMSDTTPTCSV